MIGIIDLAERIFIAYIDIKVLVFQWVYNMSRIVAAAQNGGGAA